MKIPRGFIKFQDRDHELLPPAFVHASSIQAVQGNVDGEATLVLDGGHVVETSDSMESVLAALAEWYGD